jgi:hypothetical protein
VPTDLVSGKCLLSASSMATSCWKSEKNILVVDKVPKNEENERKEHLLENLNL